MTKQKKLIIKTVNDMQGCKISQLIAHKNLLHLILDGADIAAMVQELVDDGDLVEVSYVLPQMPYREKSFLLPADTEVVLRMPPIF